MTDSSKNSDGAGKIIVKGARTHNLKNINVEVPRNKMIVFTGLSGSGKSSLAFDTIFAEGQRKYVESLSAYARQFLRQMQKPDVDEISGLSPAISIDQKSRSNNPRSTVATITEIYDYLRVLYSRIGHPHCPICDREVKKLSNEEILESILKSVEKTTKLAKKSGVKLTAGVSNAKIRISSPVVVGRKGEYYQLLYDMLNKGFEKAIVDGEEKSLRQRIELKKHFKHDIDIIVDEIFISEFTDDPKAANERASEAVERALHEADGLVKLTDANESRIVSAKFMCPYDGFSFPEVEPRLFSFNSPYGACPTCNGLGTKYIWGDEPCEACKGARLRNEAMHVFLKTKNQKQEIRKNIVEVTSMSIEEAKSFFDTLELSEKEKEISKAVNREITSRLQFMLNVGIEYLTLDRRANTLSGGEAQRIRLASQLGSGLVGALYVLDEPTIGLHQRDNDRLIETLKRLRDLGNTVLVVEHDEDTIFASDYIVDMGPGAGAHGGKIVASGWLEDLLTAKTNKSGSRTLAYLREETEIPMPEKRRTQDKGKLKIRGASKFNIKNVSVDIPLAKLVVVSGVSGSGKSTFLYEILHRNLLARFDKRWRTAKLYNVAEFTGTEYLGRSILIDQSPIGRTPRSNPATYTGAWTHIRDLFAMSEEARARGWGPGRFSFNRKGGRCETCEGNGLIAVEMHFLPTVYVTCDVCNGRRFMKETLEVKFKKKSIHDILKMTVEEAFAFFEDIPAIADRLKTLSDVGLDYLELGQSATTLSGGEAQRVKIASELYRPHQTKTMYLLDEPTVGLHYDDVAKLIEILQHLVDRGNSVVVIEHNLDVLKSADWLLDMGPEGGARGGQIVAKGTPENVAATAGSHTGHYLKRTLKKKRK
ncbi:excinuclease ABC subunit A [Candidatus Kaiserbacteria bacterium RIFCSPLOWO2_01_FULL_53_17]|uniref:UvrABC system protein A n=1 Tax=Candidatus Kaiserbacteria bacterium RIFCSPLOWO2_01_FULL_53_17 TaxID=1798511 RepID=A0A1F6EH89_9BACT|nr:MAG: excinuclease ABC subunit A [Candidatus Kaiserbacteria bacterium RIFCSPLOWO2_01_FULL_53_17]